MCSGTSLNPRHFPYTKGGVLSPSIFSIYIDSLLQKQKDSYNKQISVLYYRYMYSIVSTIMLSSSIPTCPIKVHGKPLKHVNPCVYLRSVFTSVGRGEKEVKRRIGIAKTTFTSMKKVLCWRNISIPVRLRVLKCYSWSTMLYGCETWTLSKGMMKNSEAAEHWFLRSML